MPDIKGSGRRIIEAPGYRLHPQYDLKHLRKRRSHGQGTKNSNHELPLTSMIDMFSILCIFLLMNFSSTGEIFFITKDIKIPAAGHSRPIESNPLISITKKTVTLDAEKIGDRDFNAEDKSGDLVQLRSRLQQIRIFQETIHPGVPFKGSVNIQADENLPILHIKRVMNSLISEGWTGINFAVRLDSKAQQANTEEE